jgi:hypothetical protein
MFTSVVALQRRLQAMDGSPVEAELTLLRRKL